MSHRIDPKYWSLSPSNAEIKELDEACSRDLARKPGDVSYTDQILDAIYLTMDNFAIRVSGGFCD